MRRYEYLYGVLRILRQELPVKKPVYLQRLTLKDYEGFCSKHRKKFLIQIEIKLTEDYAIEVLLHEYAHALSYDLAGANDHGTAWGKAYSRVYRCFLKHFCDDKQ